MKLNRYRVYNGLAEETIVYEGATTGTVYVRLLMDGHLRCDRYEARVIYALYADLPEPVEIVDAVDNRGTFSLEEWVRELENEGDGFEWLDELDPERKFDTVVVRDSEVDASEITWTEYERWEGTWRKTVLLTYRPEPDNTSTTLLENIRLRQYRDSIAGEQYSYGWFDFHGEEHIVPIAEVELG